MSSHRPSSYETNEPLPPRGSNRPPFLRFFLSPIFLWGLLISVMFGVMVSTVWQRPFLFSAGSPSPLPVYGQVPSFTLTDEKGRPFGNGQLEGKVWIADFIFTSCAGTCPAMTEKMRALQGELPSSVEFVSISVDPARDTPARLARYAATSGAQEGRWHFLTADASLTERLVKEGFRLSFAEGTDPQEPIAHSVRFVLLDKGGKIRGYYDATDPKAFGRLLRDARSLEAS